MLYCSFQPIYLEVLKYSEGVIVYYLSVVNIIRRVSPLNFKRKIACRKLCILDEKLKRKKFL